MIRTLTIVAVLVGLMATSAQAVLQNSLGNGSLRFLQPISIPPLIQLIPPIPEGALFIDPTKSTRGEGVFREGPDFEYNSTTGSLTVFAPPLLGPADEFGIRQQYSPNSISIFGRDFFSDTPSIPEVTKYRRNEPGFSRIGGHTLPLDDEDPSFVLDGNSDSFSLFTSPENIRVNVGFSRGLAGAEVSFSSLLLPGLDAEIFEAEEGDVLPNSIWPYLPRVERALPEIHFVIGYTSVDLRVRSPGRYSLLAVPQAALFQDSQAAVPEPSTFLLACFAVAGLLFLRRA